MGRYLERKAYEKLLQWKNREHIVYAKGHTGGGVKDNVYTIPIYGIGKFRF